MAELKYWISQRQTPLSGADMIVFCKRVSLANQAPFSQSKDLRVSKYGGVTTRRNLQQGSVGFLSKTLRQSKAEKGRWVLNRYAVAD